MFIINTSNKIPNRKLPIREAFPDSAASIPDICIINTVNNSGILLNSKLLREALLNSKDFMYDNLGIVIEDRRTKEVIKETVTRKRTPKPKPIVQEEPSIPEDVIYD